MQLYEFTSISNDSGERIVRVSGRIADSADPTQQKEYITFQFEIDAPIGQRGALLRKKVLDKAHELLFRLSRDYEQMLHRIPE